MFMYSFDKRPLTENSQRISAGVFVRNFYLQLKQKTSNDKKTALDIGKEECVKDLIKMIELESTLNLRQEVNGNLEFTEPNLVRMAYTKSNLGKGFVFWFICGVCGKKVRYLYIPPNSHITACRACHRLAYGQQNENKRFRDLDRLFR